jgi:hypothetical protein
MIGSCARLTWPTINAGWTLQFKDEAAIPIMVRRGLTTICYGVLLLCPLLCGGCGGGSPVPVSGKVTLDGKPLTRGTVRYFLVDAPVNAVVPRGSLDESGTYTLTTGGKPGAPAGKYKVCVFEDPDAGKKAGANSQVSIPMIYRDQVNTPLTVEVVSGAAGSYDLTLSTP